MLLPGLVDLHTHLREPGGEESETSPPARPPPRSAATPRCSRCPTPTRWPTPPSSSSTCAAAATRSGWSTCTRSARSRSGSRASGWPSSARWPTRAARVRMFSDDGRCVHDPLVMRRALEYASALDVVIAQHAEDHRLTEGAQAHEGVVASRLGLAGWPATAEETIVARDCALAREAGARAARLPRVVGAHDRRAAGGQGRGRAGHRRGHPAPPAAHRRARCAATTRSTRSTRRCARAPTPARCARRWPRA